MKLSVRVERKSIVFNYYTYFANRWRPSCLYAVIEVTPYCVFFSWNTRFYTFPFGGKVKKMAFCFSILFATCPIALSVRVERKSIVLTTTHILQIGYVPVVYMLWSKLLHIKYFLVETRDFIHFLLEEKLKRWHFVSLFLLQLTQLHFCYRICEEQCHI